MRYRLKLFIAYFVYLFSSRRKKGHGIHSPFLFKLITAVFSDQREYGEYRVICQQRSLFLASNEVISIDDRGAGSKIKANGGSTVKDVARHASIQDKKGRLLFKLVRFFQPSSIVEFGTSLGISTLYMAMAAPKARLVTIEASGELVRLSSESFDKLNLTNVLSVNGEFKKVLENSSSIGNHVEFVLFDGCHTMEMTWYLFEKMHSKSTVSTVFVFDDIRWSEEMERVWKTIARDPRVTLSIDLFSLGLVFFRSGMAKQHVMLKF